MKTVLLTARAMLGILLFTSKLVVAQPTNPNLLINGNFEDRNQAPQGRANIGPVDSNHPYDDLRNWRHVVDVNNTEDTPDYIASDGVLGVNPTIDIPSYGYPGYGGFTAHSGIGCVQIGRFASFTNQYDEFITQEISQALTPGHIYHAEFWALRQPGRGWRSKLALSITEGPQVPVYDAAQNTLLPSPGNKVILSGDIQQRYVWTKISGNIIIPNNQPNNKWVTIGYERAQQTTDNQAVNDPFGDIFFAIDDVSLVDIGCAIPATPQLSITRYEPCKKVVDFRIDNYDPTLTYTLTVSNTLVATPGNPIPQNFTVYGKYRVLSGDIKVTVTSPCGASSYAEDGVGFENDCPRARGETATIAYPNPATESITIPEGAEGATLVNDKGKALRKADASGRLDVQSLPDGLYNLQMMQDGKLINQRIQVKH